MKKLFLHFNLIVLVLTFSSFSTLKSQTNQYLDFDGTDDWVSSPNASALIANSSSFSITGWFYERVLSYGQGLMGFRSGGQGFYMIELGNGQIECRFSNSAGTLYEYVAPANTIIPNVWQHYAWVYDGSSVKLYLNGVLKGSAAASGTINATNIAFAIGKSPLGSFTFYYNGGIDEVSVWKKGLSQTEVQDIMQNELTGTETDLVLYYKFNQGIPNGNNQTISKLISNVNTPLYDGDLLNFALTGTTSNFRGTLDTSFQAISFPLIPNKLITSPPFKLIATATSGLPVGFTVVSGPATISNDTCYLTGAGVVTIKAYQNGNATYDTAAPAINIFHVIDPAANMPIIEERNPLNGDVFMPNLAKIQLAAIVDIDFPELFNVASVQFKANGVNVPTNDFHNGHYTGWWQPSAYGSSTIEIVATSNMGAVATKTVNINVVSSVSDLNFSAFDSVLINTDISSQEVEATLPCYVGAFDSILTTLKVTCPVGGCGEWDRVASIDIKSPEGNWFEIIRYITPYGTACSHTTNLADYSSLLQGKVTFRVNCSTLDNGYLYELKFNYQTGTPPHLYSQVQKVWKDGYQFGDYANLQPVPPYNLTFPTGTVESKIKLVSTGHGWGTLNTGNAAEFYNCTHSIYANNVNTFTQHNWQICNPNPDNCSPQNGTWYNNRAGWCPGAIAKPFNYSLNNYVSASSVVLKYVFYEQYVDLCHPNHPNCNTSVCSNCQDGFNPYLDVNCNAIHFFDTPPPAPVGIKENIDFEITVFPNPSHGIVNITSNETLENNMVRIFNSIGVLIKEFDWDGTAQVFDLSYLNAGFYFIRVYNAHGMSTKKFIIQ